MTTISKLVVIPNEYKERMSAGHFNPEFTGLPDSQKPLIYVTDPNDREDELWVPPVQEYNIHQMEEDSDDDTCTCSDKSIELERGSETEEYMMEDVESVTSSHNEDIAKTSEMWFYRTGWQNRAVRASDNGSSGTFYYVEIPWRSWGTSMTVHRGHRDGEVVADVERTGPGQPFDITFSDPRQRYYIGKNGALTLKFGCIYSRSHKFEYRGRRLAWKHALSTRRLRDLDTDEVIAEFDSKSFSSLHKDGKMVFLGEYAKDPYWVDVIVITALACQQREREIRRTSGSSSGAAGGSTEKLSHRATKSF